jgi:long-chain acyl-CoA synthetase
VAELNQKFSSPEQVKKFTVLPRDLSVDDGELTPTLKIRRKQIRENWADEIETMYS